MKIGVDFDRVLFKTDEFNKFLKQETDLYHVDADVYNEKGCYSLEKHVKAADADMNEVYNAMKDLSDFVYGDIEMLEELDKHTLVIVTRGGESFQMRKVNGSGIKKYFEDVFVVQEGSKNVGSVEFLVDDREEEIERADLPGMVFDREKHTMKDLISKIGELE